ncbi:hypothetical protein SRHO_G00262720 [Serrasalmus rhombeus]
MRHATTPKPQITALLFRRCFVLLLGAQDSSGWWVVKLQRPLLEKADALLSSVSGLPGDVIHCSSKAEPAK